MSWFGVSLNDIKGQLTSFTSEVLSEGLEGVEGDCRSLLGWRRGHALWRARQGRAGGRGGVLGSALSRG